MFLRDCLEDAVKPSSERRHRSGSVAKPTFPGPGSGPTAATGDFVRRRCCRKSAVLPPILPPVRHNRSFGSLYFGSFKPGRRSLRRRSLTGVLRIQIGSALPGNAPAIPKTACAIPSPTRPPPREATVRRARKSRNQWKGTVSRRYSERMYIGPNEERRKPLDTNGTGTSQCFLGQRFRI